MIDSHDQHRFEPSGTVARLADRLGRGGRHADARECERRSGRRVFPLSIDPRRLVYPHRHPPADRSISTALWTIEQQENRAAGKKGKPLAEKERRGETRTTKKKRQSKKRRTDRQRERSECSGSAWMAAASGEWRKWTRREKRREREGGRAAAKGATEGGLAAAPPIRCPRTRPVAQRCPLSLTHGLMDESEQRRSALSADPDSTRPAAAVRCTSSSDRAHSAPPSDSD